MAQSKALSPIDGFKKSLELNKPEIAKVLPKHIEPDKFMRVLQTAAVMRPELASADRRSLWGEIAKCAQDGLLPNGHEATINVYGSKASYIPMVAGILKKARNSGLIKNIDAVVVYENDHYESWIDEHGPHFKFMRSRGDRGNVKLTFGYATTQDGGFYHEEIDEKEMSAIEKMSKAKTGPWKGDFKDQMRRKSAIRRLAKRLPSSADVDNVIRRDDPLFDLPHGQQPDKPTATDGPSRLKNIIETEEESTSSTMPEEVEIVDSAPVEAKMEEPPI